MRVSVVIPTCNKHQYLNLTLASLAKQSYKKFEVIVIDDGSTDETASVVMAWEKKLTILFVQQNQTGRAGARNSGLRMARGELILFCDDDRIAPETFIHSHVLAAFAGPRMVTVGWKRRILTCWSDNLPLKPGDKVRIKNSMGLLSGEHASGNERMIVTPDDIERNLEKVIECYELGDEEDNYSALLQASPDEWCQFTMPWIIGTTANLSFPRCSVPEDLLFDERFSGWGMEDTDFCLALYLAGFEFQHSMEAVNYHQIHPIGTGSVRAGRRQRAAEAMQNIRYFCEKHQSPESYLFWRIQQGLSLADANTVMSTITKKENSIICNELISQYVSALHNNLSDTDLQYTLSGTAFTATHCRVEAEYPPGASPQVPGPISVQEDGYACAALPRLSNHCLLPPQTNKWWTPLLWQFDHRDFCSNMFPHPFCARATRTGLALGYPDTSRISHDGRTYDYPFRTDIEVRCEFSGLPQLNVLNYGDWSVSFSWQHQKECLTGMLGQGHPFACFKVNQLSDIILAGNGYMVIMEYVDHCVRFRVSGRNYAAFGPKGCTWTVQNGELRLHVGDSGYFSVAILPDASDETFNLFRQHSMVFPYNTVCRWSLLREKSTIAMNFETSTEVMEGEERRILQALYPHHWNNTEAALTDLYYESPRGKMKLMVGNSFSISLPYTGVLPALPVSAGVDRRVLWEMIERVINEVDGESLWPSPLEGEEQEDGYWVGKNLLRLSQLATYAEACGHERAQNRLLDEIELCLNKCLGFDGPARFYYEETWHTLLYRPSGYHGLCESVNDHAYCYGYFLQAIAVLIRYRPEWIALPQRIHAVRMLILDVSNPDAHNRNFPRLRCFDIYSGHSWGSGTGAYPMGLNAEPSSEAINYATAVITIGGLLDDEIIVELGAVLYACETDAALRYWFNVDANAFPARFQYPCVGMIWGGGASHQAWFSQRSAEAIGVNLIPMQSGSLYLAKNPHIKEIYSFIENEGGGAPTTWADVHWMHLALAEPEEALQRFLSVSSHPVEWGNSHAHTYVWLSMLSDYGQPVSHVAADAASWAVFRKGAVWTYVIYNAARQEQSVRFTDEFCCIVPPRCLIVKQRTK